MRINQVIILMTIACIAITNTCYAELQGIRLATSRNKDYLYVLDTGDYRIEKYSLTGKLLTTWNSDGNRDKQLLSPGDIKVSLDENVYVGDNGYIKELAANGRFGSRWITSRHISVIAMWIDISGNIYIINFNGDIEKYDINRNLKMRWEQNDNKGCRLINPVDIVVDASGYMYVLDRMAKQVIKFDRSRHLISAWGDGKDRESDLRDPTALAIDEIRGKIYVVDQKRIVKYDTNGKYIRDWVVSSEIPWEKWPGWPQGIAVDRKGCIYVGYQGVVKPSIAKYDQSGQLITRWRRTLARK